jgi:hypothetical protein
MSQPVAQRLALEAAAEGRLLYWPARSPREGQYWERVAESPRGRRVPSRTVEILIDDGLAYLPERWVASEEGPVPVRVTREGTRHVRNPYRCVAQNLSGLQCRNRVPQENGRCAQHAKG